MSDTPSLHETIRSEIEDNILTGRWPPGFRIPSEVDLCARYDCSRMTVSKAMTELVRAGLIARKRRAGSVVLAQRSQDAILEIHDVKDEVLALGMTYDYRLIERIERPISTEERHATGLPPRRKVISLISLHYADAVPFCLEERIINPVAVPTATEETFAIRAPGPWLLDHVPWSEAEHRIGAEPAGKARAEILKRPPETACLIVERTTWKLGEAVTHVRFTYPGQLFQLQARFTPRSSD